MFVVTFRTIVSSNASETKIMRKNFLRITILAAAIAGTFLVLGSWKTAPQTPACEESMKECCKKKNRNADNTIWETGSGQIFSYSNLN
jgi:hypothetical protein